MWSFSACSQWINILAHMPSCSLRSNYPRTVEISSPFLNAYNSKPGPRLIAFFIKDCCLDRLLTKSATSCLLLLRSYCILVLCFLSMCLFMVDSLKDVNFSKQTMHVINLLDLSGHIRYPSFHIGLNIALLGHLLLLGG